jgi:hypothetical protein
MDGIGDNDNDIEEEVADQGKPNAQEQAKIGEQGVNDIWVAR